MSLVPQVANLHAFARLYGVVRWFHPSDAAAAVDWDRFAIDGIRSTIGASDARAVQIALTELFAPIAPTVQFALHGERFADEPALHPASLAGLELVSWEHEGYGDTEVTSGYLSKRRHRNRIATMDGYPFAAVRQAIDAAPYRGKVIRLRGRVRTAGGARGQLWLRVERGDLAGFSDDMSDRAVMSDAWTTAEVSGPVDIDATQIVFGAQQWTAKGTGWYDDLELATQTPDGSWTQIAVANGGFESGDPLRSWKAGLGGEPEGPFAGWKISVDHVRSASGDAALRFDRTTEVSNKELFEDAPEAGETVDVDLGGDLRARVPIALYSKDGRTLGGDPAAARRLRADTQLRASSGYDVFAGLADVVVAWNVLQHFWPYWDTVSVDWSSELDIALRDALDDRTVDDHYATLQRLAAAAPDAHARIACPGRAHYAMPPFAVDVVEGQIVVTASADPQLRRGDIVVSVDGQPAAAELEKHEVLASGSPQFRRVRARWRFGNGPMRSTLPLRLRRGDSDLEIVVHRDDRTIPAPSGDPIRRFDDGVYYIDLSRTSMATINERMTQLASAPGVVFDLRDHPNGVHQVLSHLLTHADDAKDWLHFPRIIRPDHAANSISSWRNDGWELKPVSPHISGRIAFLVGPATASYGESIIGLVEHYRLGELVGSTTAGANGDYAQIAEPSGCSSIFTGLRVTKLDGSRLHLLGFAPTIPAAPTIEGIRAGRDEVLEKALGYVRTGAK